MNQLAIIALTLFFLVIFLAWCPPCMTVIQKIRSDAHVFNPMNLAEGFKTAYCPEADPTLIRRQQLPLSDVSFDFAKKTPDFRLAM